MTPVCSAFLLTAAAGAATGIGAFAAFFMSSKKTGVLSCLLGFSAGVMIFIAFRDIWNQALFLFLQSAEQRHADWAALFFFGIGAATTALIDVLIPKAQNPHAFDQFSNTQNIVFKKDPSHLMRLGILMTGVFILHNFPEGFAVFMMSASDPAIGPAIALAIALHNIPEGIVVATPIYYATKSRQKAFWIAAVSGLAEPLGAIIGYALLAPFLTPFLLGALFAAIAGMMVYIAFDELIPTARAYGHPHLSVWGIFSGMVLIGISLSFF